MVLLQDIGSGTPIVGDQRMPAPTIIFHLSARTPCSQAQCVDDRDVTQILHDSLSNIFRICASKGADISHSTRFLWSFEAVGMVKIGVV